MGRVGLVRTLKGTTVVLAVMALGSYLGILPQQLREAADMYDMAWLEAPGIAAISVSAVPIAVALVFFWMICTEIGRDNSFCRRSQCR